MDRRQEKCRVCLERQGPHDVQQGGRENGLGERLEDGVGYYHRIGYAHAHGERPLGTDHPPHWHDHLQVAEAAVVDGIMGCGGQAFERDLRAGNASGHAGIVEAPDLTTHFSEVNGHLVTSLLHAYFDRNFLFRFPDHRRP